MLATVTDLGVAYPSRQTETLDPGLVLGNPSPSLQDDHFGRSQISWLVLLQFPYNQD